MDGKALVHMDVEGARQVSSRSTLSHHSADKSVSVVRRPVCVWRGTGILIRSACVFTPTLFLFFLLQRLSINVAAVPVAENMMDLIDGYCRLEKDTDDTIIYRPNKSVLTWILAHNQRAKWLKTSY